MAYSYNELRDIWIRNGGSTGASYIAAAIAMAESGGNPLALNSKNTNGTVDRGLWQINSVHGSLSTFDVNANARAAIQISGNGTNWTPWTVYNTGAYRKYVDLNATGIPYSGATGTAVGPEDSSGGLFDSLTKPFTDISGSISQIIKGGEWFANPHNIIRIAQVVSGIILALLGVAILERGLIEDAMGDVIAIATKAAAAAA